MATHTKDFGKITTNVFENDSDYKKNAGYHNSIYRGKYLGTAPTADMYSEISAGTFGDLFIGDYFAATEDAGLKWIIAHFDYWYNIAGDNKAVHHVVIVPSTALFNHVMNSSNITTGAYVGSNFYTANDGRAAAITQINGVFGSGHIMHYNNYLQNSVTGSAPVYENGQVWTDCSVELMSEIMVYGSNIFHNIQAGGSVVPSLYTVDKEQLALFRLDHSKITTGGSWWLRDVVSGTFFALVHGNGGASNTGASNAYGIRPAFGIRA